MLNENDGNGELARLKSNGGPSECLMADTRDSFIISSIGLDDGDLLGSDHHNAAFAPSPGVISRWWDTRQRVNVARTNQSTHCCLVQYGLEPNAVTGNW